MPHGATGVSINHDICGIGWGLTERDIAIRPAHPERPSTPVNDTLLDPSVNRLYVDHLHNHEELEDIRRNMVSYLTTPAKIKKHNPFRVTSPIFQNPLAMFALTKTRRIVRKLLESNPKLETQNHAMFRSLSSFILNEDLMVAPSEWLKLLAWLETVVEEEEKESIQAALQIVSTYGQNNKHCQLFVASDENLTSTVVDDELYISMELPMRTLTIVVPNWPSLLGTLQHAGTLHGLVPIGSTQRTQERMTQQILVRGDRTLTCNKKKLPPPLRGTKKKKQKGKLPPPPEGDLTKNEKKLFFRQ